MVDKQQEPNSREVARHENTTVPNQGNHDLDAVSRALEANSGPILAETLQQFDGNRLRLLNAIAPKLLDQVWIRLEQAKAKIQDVGYEESQDRANEYAAQIARIRETKSAGTFKQEKPAGHVPSSIPLTGGDPAAKSR